MRNKPNWEEYIHSIRKREIDIIFSKFPNRLFENGLEIGAGDGFQSVLLSSHIKYLICTEYNEKRLKKQNSGRIIYKICDAEIIDEYFDAQSFDLIFASHVLEHLGNREQALQRIHNLLKDDGLFITIVPNFFVKLCYLLLFYPNQFIEVLEVITKSNGIKKIFKRIFFNYDGSGEKEDRKKNIDLRNNRKSLPKKFFLGLLFPSLHGEYSNHFEELMMYRKKKWFTLLQNNKFEIKAILKMPVASGYGFGLNGIRKILENIGLCSSYAYIAYKK